MSGISGGTNHQKGFIEKHFSGGRGVVYGFVFALLIVFIETYISEALKDKPILTVEVHPSDFRIPNQVHTKLDDKFLNKLSDYEKGFLKTLINDEVFELDEMAKIKFVNKGDVLVEEIKVDLKNITFANHKSGELIEIKGGVFSLGDLKPNTDLIIYAWSAYGFGYQAFKSEAFLFDNGISNVKIYRAPTWEIIRIIEDYKYIILMLAYLFVVLFAAAIVIKFEQKLKKGKLVKESDLEETPKQKSLSD